MNPGTNSPRTPQRKATPEEITKLRAKLKHQQQKDREIVKGIFRFYEVPGGHVEFCYKAYAGDEVENFLLYDGQVYSLPLGVARHLNKNGWYPVHTHAVDDNGKAIFKIGQKVQRFGFQSLEFVDIDDIEPAGTPLVTVEKVSNG